MESRGNKKQQLQQQQQQQQQQSSRSEFRSTASASMVQQYQTSGGQVAQQQQQIQQQASGRFVGNTLQQQTSFEQQRSGHQQQQQQQTPQVTSTVGTCPPIFEQAFRNARFAKGGNAAFEGKIRGNPKPTVSWIRKGQILPASQKHQMQYDVQTGRILLRITSIGPGDEGEYTCVARNQYGEALCTVFIQPEGSVPTAQQLEIQRQQQMLQQQQLLQQQQQQQVYVQQQQFEIQRQQSYEVQGQQQHNHQQPQLAQQRQVNVHQQQHQQFANIQQINSGVQSNSNETFKVDTFEYRLLREAEYRQAITRRQPGEPQEPIPPARAQPKIIQKPRNSKLAEKSTATFSVGLSGGPARLTWFKDGQRVKESNKIKTNFDGKTSTLSVTNASPLDSGHYTLLAENASGCVVSSSHLVVERPEQADQTATSGKPADTANAVNDKSQAPTFTSTPPSDIDVTELKSLRLEARVAGRPPPEVTWFINGSPLQNDALHKVLVNEAGQHSLLITAVHRQDAGVLRCVARNKAGEAAFEVNINVVEKEQLVAPKFVERFSTVHVREDEPVELFARAVGTPVPRMTWQKDGVPVSSNSNIVITSDGGASKLEIPRASHSDSAWYQCMAQNAAGSTATRARLFVERPQETPGQPWRLQLPKPTKVIEPEKPPSPEVIFLKPVERTRPKQVRQEQDRTFEPPVFLTPLRDAKAIEGTRAHFEAKVHPVGDPTMRVEWFFNGVALSASSRANLTNRFGFIALDLLSLVRLDAGVYTCVVSSATGSAESSATLTVEQRSAIERTTNHPESWEKIQQLEDVARYSRQESIEESSRQKPVFTKHLVNLGELSEGKNAHFEATLTPVSDAHMRVEWFKDGKPLTASSRISTVFNFGYVSLNIQHLRPEDSGTYTVRAANRAGEALSQAVLQVAAKSSVTGSLGIPEQQKYIQSVEELEAYSQLSQLKNVEEVLEPSSPPAFKPPIQDQLNIRENGFAHFEARLEPVGDSKLKVEWLKDGRPVEASSRITTFFNFGYVALTVKQVTTHDQGTYTCKATNALGQAATSAKLTVVSKKNVVVDSQHPEGLEKIQYLEDSSRYQRNANVVEEVKQVPPRFLGPMKGTNKIKEHQRAHFECRLEPQSDSTLKVEWYHNGKPLMPANRIQTCHDFGYVALDITKVRAEDAGLYTCVARNALGEARLEGQMVVEVNKNVDTTAIHQVQDRRVKEHVEPQYEIEEVCKSKPNFVQPLQDLRPLPEGKPIHLEARLEPMGDPTMTVEWFFNGKPITVGSRFKTYYDFGYVALDVISTTSMDTGEYTVRATNKLGTAHSSAMVRVIGKSDVDLSSLNEAALEQISYLEDASRYKRETEEEVFQAQPPVFTKPLKNASSIELSNVHLEGRLKPVGDSSMRVEWYCNNKPIPVGHRFRPAYEFDYVALDILSVYTTDSGVYTCRAVNSLGEAVTSCSLHVIARKDANLGENGETLERFQMLEDTSRYRRSEAVDEAVTTKPKFTSLPKNVSSKEHQTAHFEAKLEPVADSSLAVEWFKDGKPLMVGSRFRPIHDFGYVALDIVGLVPQDAGVYTCRAVNRNGVDTTNVELKVKAGKSIVTGSQVETKSMEQIQSLEQSKQHKRSGSDEEVVTSQAPVFTTSLKNVSIKEMQRAHFESRLIPVSDNTMKVEWFKDGEPIKSGSRFNETVNFGHVALDINQCTPEDTGVYTCRATNALGQAVTSAQLAVQSKARIIRETQNASSLASLQTLEERNKAQKTTQQDEMVNQAPFFTQPPKNVHQVEQKPVHFEARLIPVGDSKLKVEWLKNGIPIQASNRISTMHDFGFVSLDLKWVTTDDTGTYTCRAVNDLGQAVTSANLVVISKADAKNLNDAALEKIRMLEDTSRYARAEHEEVVVNKPPRFVTQLNGPTDLAELQSSHYECRIEPYPDDSMKVDWFKDGKPLPSGHRFRPVYDFGFAALDLLELTAEDSGEYVCKATNKVGTATSKIQVNVKPKSNLLLDTHHADALQKIQKLEKPQKAAKPAEVAQKVKPDFVRPLRNIDNVPQGQPVHLEATLTPVNDETLKVEWYRNGVPIPQGHRFKTVNDFGYVSFDILYAYPEDSGVYTCRAVNAAGEAVTTSSVEIKSQAGLDLQTMDEARLQKLKTLEAPERPKLEDVAPKLEAPKFVTPLNSLDNLKEADHAHLECRLTPVNDANLKVEWYVNGVAIKTGHRFRTTHDFGYVALDVLYAYPEDSGVYMCKATNAVGEAVNTCNIVVSENRNIFADSQHPEGWAKIKNMESAVKPAKLEVEEPKPIQPKFSSNLVGTTQVLEGERAHFECRVEPVRDASLRVEWFHNGKPLSQGNRFHTTHDFGYVALDINHCVPEDAGEYTAKAINSLGQAVNSISMKVISKGAIITESQRPEGLDKIRALEQPKEAPKHEEAPTFQRPVFTVPLQNLDGLSEMDTAHFEGRLIPVNDSNLKVEWFRNDKLLEESSRMKKTHDFGFVSLDISKIRPEDEGVYMCRASNDLGEAVTTASMSIKSKSGIQADSQHPAGLAKIQQLEAPSLQKAPEPEKLFEKPVFTATLTGPAELWEGENAHFECRVIPVGDASLKYEWFCNGRPLKQGSRIKANHDFGFVTLDVASVIPEDSGVYMCKVSNNAGEAITSCSMKVKTRSSIQAQSAHPQAWDKIQQKEAQIQERPEFVDALPTQPPVFTTHLVSHDNLKEAQNLHLEAFVEPRGDPFLVTEWFKNGKPLATGTRLRTTFDFGLVTLDVTGLRSEDAGIYVCKARNKYGEDVSTCQIRVESSSWLKGETMRPEALPKIQELEQPKIEEKIQPEVEYGPPLILGHLNNLELNEGENGHFECRVEPYKDASLKIEWLVNGKPLQPAAKLITKNDFGLISLDIEKCYPLDEGIYTVRATNRKGQATTSGTLKVKSKQSIFLNTQHPKGQAGLDKVKEIERDFAAKQNQRRPSAPEAVYQKPYFIVPLEPKIDLIENDHLHMEARIEPKEDPMLKVEWFFNGKPLEQGARCKHTFDFGFVSLDIADVSERDQGLYTCRGYNKYGEAFTASTVYVTNKQSLVFATQHPKGKEGLDKIHQLEDSKRPVQKAPSKDFVGMPPKFTSQFQNLQNMNEGALAHFEASLIPVNDESMKVEWFFNGKPLDAAHRFRTVYAFGMVVLEVQDVMKSDAGTYTCRATNNWGKDEISVQLGTVDFEQGKPPKFTTQLQPLENLYDGQSAHFEATLVPVGDPDMVVEWFHNGKPLQQSSRIKAIYDFGYVVLDIAQVQTEDSGEYECRARNKYGSDKTKAPLRCLGKGGVYYDTLQPDAYARILELESFGKEKPDASSVPRLMPPKFTEHFQDQLDLKEGQSAHFEARLIPIDDPDLQVEWYYNGVKLRSGHKFRTFQDFGIVILDVLYCYEEDSGVYECRAWNKLGEDWTRATLKCASKASLIFEPQIPKRMMGGLNKIQNIEDSMNKKRRQAEDVRVGRAPVFTTPLSNIDGLLEGENAHFEAKLTPTDDPKLKVEWFWNGRPLKTGSRFKTFNDFGFVILEIASVYAEDTGEYSCRASNEYGEAVTVCTMKCSGKRNLILDSQLRNSSNAMDKIAELEGYGQDKVVIEEIDDSGKPPALTQLHDMTLPENGLAHFECQLSPVDDSSMRIDWFHNGKLLSTGSRVKTINDFGFVILEIAGVYARDAGLYVCKATNRHGEATSQCALTVKGKQGIVSEPQLPNHFKTGTEAIQKLEENLRKRDELVIEDEKPNPPRFITEIADIDVSEGQAAHFDCRVEPAGDSTMRTEWYFNGRPLVTGSRVHTNDDFGFVSLDLDWTFARDSGEYICRAVNKWGFATTRAKLICKGKRNIVMESQLPGGLDAQKLNELERGPMVSREEKEVPSSPPKFISHIQNYSTGEGEPAHFECRVEPKTDSRLAVDWFKDGKPLQTGSRFKTTYDFGFVSLDIAHTYPEDAGVYTCRAKNDIGEDLTRASLSCKKLPSIILANQMPKGMKKSETLVQMEAAIKKHTAQVFLTEDDIYDADKKQPPRFVTQIQDQINLSEMQGTKFECQLAPVGDPNLKVEWFHNGKPLTHKNRLTPIYDFGYVAMNFEWVYPEDSGEYICRATNLYGSDETKAVIKSSGKPTIVYESQLPAGMHSIDRIREMESNWQRTPEQAPEAEKQREAPVFVTKPEPQEVYEGDWAKFVCRVTGFPRPRLLWLVNGKTVTNGTRYKLTYDGMHHLDIPKTRQYDHGTVEVIAKNSSGEAYAKTTLVVRNKHEDYRGVLKNAPRPFYDADMKQSVDDRNTELDQAFEQRVTAGQQSVRHAPETFGNKAGKEEVLEWQQKVLNKKGDDYYGKIKELEESQLLKEQKIREQSRQQQVSGEKKSLATKMASSYEQKVAEEEQAKQTLREHAQKVSKKDVSSVFIKSNLERTENEVSAEQKNAVQLRKTRTDEDQSLGQQRRNLEPTESAVHGKEIQTSTSKQTQKENRGDLEITRKITATETSEMEHKGKTTERVVQGPVKPAKPPVFTKKIQPCRVYEKEPAKFEVEFDGDPLPTVRWFRENFEIQNSDDFRIHTFSTKSVLQIREVFIEDSGIFSVIAENRGGQAKCSANLVVEEKPSSKGSKGGPVPPSFLNTIQDKKVKAGAPLRFDAKVAGAKPLDIYWLKDGKKIVPDLRHKIAQDQSTYSVIISNTVVDDSGKYECVAINSVGEARCEAEATVEATPSASKGVKQQQSGDQAPQIVEQLKSVTVPEGQGAAFRCRIQGRPSPSVKWTKDDKPLKQSKYFKLSVENDAVLLRITETFPEDEGTYKVTATNSKGTVSSAAVLKILPQESAEAPPTLTPLKNVTVNEGQPAQFRTQVTGNPTIQWFREGALIPNTDDFAMVHEGPQAVLLIKMTYEEDSGTFSCRATNSAGQAEVSAVLTVKSQD